MLSNYWIRQTDKCIARKCGDEGWVSECMGNNTRFFSLSGKFYVVQLANRTTLVSKQSVIILGLRLVTTCWSWAWTNRTSPSNGVGLGSPLAACSVYGDLTCSAHTVNSLWLFNCQWHAYLCNWWPYVRLACMPNMLLCSWNKVIIIIIKGTLPFISVQHASFPVFYTEATSAGSGEPANPPSLAPGVSPEPSLFAHMTYGTRRRLRPKIRHLAPLDGCAFAFEERVYGGRKVS